jgi:hypothetical protein
MTTSIEYEKAILENADHFTAVRGRDPRRRLRAHFDTLDMAVAWSVDNFNDKLTMIYAVTADGRDAHIRNV